MQATDDLLTAWGRWCRVVRKRGRSVSAEGGYRAPSDIDREPAPIRTHTIDDLMRCDYAWRGLAGVPKMLIKLHYVDRASAKRIASMCRIPAVDFTVHHRLAVEMVARLVRFRRRLDSHLTNYLR